MLQSSRSTVITQVGEAVDLDDTMCSVTFDTHTAAVLIGHWSSVFQNSDHCFNQQVKVLDVRDLASHGLARRRICHQETMEDNFGNECLFNRFAVYQ